MTPPPPAPISLSHACPADSFWERWCRTASPEQKQHLLPAAIRSGLVQMHHLPVPGLQASRNAVQNLVASILANRPPKLEPVAPDGVPIVDAALDDDQRHAVAVALSSPDLSLILGRPGSGKSRVVGEILRQAVARSLRVLFVAPTGSPLDRVVERSADLAPCILRCPGAHETLPPSSVASSLQARIQQFDGRTLPSARNRVEDAKGRLAPLSALEDTWPRLRAIPARLGAIAARRAALEGQRQSLASVVEKEWSPAPDDASSMEWADLCRRQDEAERGIDVRLRQLEDRFQAIEAEVMRLGAELASLTAQTKARGLVGWWTLSYWKDRGRPDPAPRIIELERLLGVRRADLAVSGRERDAQLATRQRDRDEVAARGADFRRAEVQRRDADLVRELQDASVEAAALEAEWVAVLPGEIHPRVVEAAEQTWRDEFASASGEFASRLAWLAALEEARPGLAHDLVLGARILAAPASEVLALGPDRLPGAFDLLVIEDAHRVSEKDLLALTRLAPRCVLVGEPGVTIPLPHDPKRVGGPCPDPASAHPFLALWASLHPDPVRVSTVWTRNSERLVARLHPSGPEDEAYIVREPVFDRPEIELAIRTPPGAAPHVVEVCFPASTRLEDAKDFLYRESGDLSIQSFGPGFRWREAEDAVHLHLGPPAAASEIRVGLDAGVTEHLGRCESALADEPAWNTTGLSFARADGWCRDTAADWLDERLGLRDVGRTACLGRIHRGRPALSSFLTELLFPRPDAGPHLSTTDAVGFVPCGEPRDGADSIRPGAVDEPPAHSNGTATPAPRVVRPRAGAGLEVDLGDTRRLDAIGPELRSGLPPRGIVNLQEARLVVATLEAVARDPLLGTAFASVADADSHVAVLSLHPAQVELLRLLVRRSAALAESGLRILVGHPSALAHRDCPLVCLGLTRSHSSRAVPFSDDPRDLFLALTRATDRALVFGDPGTMARRGQWFGALDHLTEKTGPVEQALLSRLLTHLTERAAPARPST